MINYPSQGSEFQILTNRLWAPNLIKYHFIQNLFIPIWPIVEDSQKKNNVSGAAERMELGEPN